MPSTVIAHINYNEEKQTLRVRFLSGKVYDYKDVPPEIFAAMKAARSKGTFLNQYIKKNYEYEEVQE